MVVLHFYDHVLRIFLVNVKQFTFYHSNDGSVGIPIPENIEIDTSFICLCQLLMNIKPFLNFHTSIGGHLGFGHFMDTGGKLSLALYLKSVSTDSTMTSLTSIMQILVLLPPIPTIRLIFATYPPH